MGRLGMSHHPSIFRQNISNTHCLHSLVQGSTSLVLRQLLCWLFLESFSSCPPLRPRHPGLHLMSTLQIYSPILYYYVLRFFFSDFVFVAVTSALVILFHMFPCMHGLLRVSMFVEVLTVAYECS